ncbi:MAG TPA: hypothetical protein PLD47_11590 [Aggregatilineales bacterium]|nr:hypothetical protein [Anaerolineales bacterium]HRE48357.1 hypothetical protein [Aggregatilineales bacterium]
MANHNDDPQDPQLKTTEGLIVSTVNDIHILNITNLRRETVDVLLDIIALQNKTARETHSHLRRLFILKGIFPTPYFTTRVLRDPQKYQAPPHSSNAVVTNDGLMWRVVRGLIGKLDTSADSTTHMVGNEAEAYAWLDARHKTLGT